MKIAITFLTFFLILYSPLCSGEVKSHEIKNLEVRLTGTPGKEKVSAYLAMADTFGKLQKKEEQLECISRALKIAKDIHDSQGIGKAYIKLGSFYEKDFEVALKYYFQALEMKSEGKGAYEDYRFIYLRLGLIYANLGDFDKCLVYQFKGLNLAQDAKNKLDIAIFYNQLGLTYSYKKEYESALDYYRKALAANIQVNRRDWIRGTKTNMANIYRDMGNHEEAVRILLGLLPEFRKEAVDYRLSKILYHIGKNYYLMKRYQEAEKYYEESLGIVKSIDNQAMTGILYKDLAELYSRTGKFKEALIYYKNHILLRDRISNREKQEQIVELQEKYEAEKRDKEIGFLKREKKNQMQVFGFVFVIILIILAFILKKYIYLFTFWKRQKYIGQYRILDRISSGGMGDVYKTHDIRNKTALKAIKVLKEELFESQDNIKRFKREGSIIDRLNHPNILKIHERGEYEGKLYIVMEYIEGVTLESIIMEKRTLDLKTGLHIMIQVSQALVFIHSLEIVHRDLKPANIMVTQVGEDKYFVKLLDFGLSKVLYHSRLTETGMLIGTLSYQAPEQVSSQDFSLASDIFSLGRVFYELLLGKTEYDSDSMATVVEKILNESPVPPVKLRPDLSFVVSDLIVRMLHKDMAVRPTAGQVLEVLGGIKT